MLSHLRIQRKKNASSPFPILPRLCSLRFSTGDPDPQPSTGRPSSSKRRQIGLVASHGNTSIAAAPACIDSACCLLPHGGVQARREGRSLRSPDLLHHRLPCLKGPGAVRQHGIRKKFPPDDSQESGLRSVGAMSVSSELMLDPSRKRKQPIESFEHGHSDSFPTSFHSASRRSVRRRLFSQSDESSQPVLSAAISNKKRVAPSTSGLCFNDSQLSSSRVVRRRMRFDPAEPQQTNPRLPIKRRPKCPLLDSTSDFPNDFKSSSSRRTRSSQLQMPIEYQTADSFTSFEAWQELRSDDQRPQASLINRIVHHTIMNCEAQRNTGGMRLKADSVAGSG
ncbi:hypothetical protein EJB05_26563, partial [Eragrostis curvula]